VRDRVTEDATAEPVDAPARAVARPDLATLPHAIGNAAMGRLLRSIAPAMVARDLREMNAPAEREIGPKDGRPRRRSSRRMRRSPTTSGRRA
jgi:hypothetical protein